MMLILMSRHLMIKKHFPRSLLFCCGLLVKKLKTSPASPPSQGGRDGRVQTLRKQCVRAGGWI